MSIIYIKLLISVALITAAAVFWIKRDFLKGIFENQSEWRVLSAGWVLFRLVPFVLVYILLNIDPQSDVEGFWEEASLAFQGKIVYRDFWSPYSPLYPYFLALGLYIWYSSKMIVLIMAVMDGLALWLSNRFYHNVIPRGERLWKSLLYLTLPGSLMLCVLGGQEDVWMWLFVLLAYFSGKVRGNIRLYSLILALGLLITKAIFVLVLIPLFWIEKKKLQFAIPMALVGLITVGVLFPLVGWEFMQPLDEAKVLRAPNLLSVINPLVSDSIGVGKKFWNWAALVFTLGLGIITFLKLNRQGFQAMLSGFWVVVFATMMIVQQSAYSNYIFLFLIPLVFYIINWESRQQVICLFLFNILCVIHPSWWWRLGMPVYTNIQMIFSRWEYAVDYVMQVVIVVLAVYLIRLAYPAGIRNASSGR